MTNLFLPLFFIGFVIATIGISIIACNREKTWAGMCAGLLGISIMICGILLAGQNI